MRLRHVGMAFFWACSMLTFRSSILLAGEANTPEWETIVVILSFVANMTTMLALAAWVENDPERIDRLPSWPLPALTVAGLVLVFASGRVGGVAMLPLLLGGAVLAGVGYGYFWGSWADCYGRMHPARTSFYLPVAFLLTAVLFLAVSLLSENLGVPAILLMVPLPVASFVCLSRCRAEVPDGRAAREGGTKRSMAALGSLLGLIIASLVLSCLFGFVWEAHRVHGRIGERGPSRAAGSQPGGGGGAGGARPVRAHAHQPGHGLPHRGAGDRGAVRRAALFLGAEPRGAQHHHERQLRRVRRHHLVAGGGRLVRLRGFGLRAGRYRPVAFRAAAPHRHRHRLSGHAGSRRAERAHRGRVHRGAVRAGDARLVQRAAPQAPCDHPLPFPWKKEPPS